MNPNQTAQNLRRKFSLIAQKNSVPYTNENGEFDETWKEKFGGSSKEIKILNVVQTGTLTRDGAIYSGFSGSNYLQLGDKVNGGYLDFVNIVKDFGAAIENADSWEMVLKFKYKFNNAFQLIFGQNAAWGSGWGPTETYKIYAGFSNSSGSQDIGSITGNTTLVDGNEYFIKVEFTGTQYKLYLSVDGINYTEEGSITSPTKLTNRAIWRIGNGENGNHALASSLDLSESYIKINGEDWWKGVEIL